MGHSRGLFKKSFQTSICTYLRIPRCKMEEVWAASSMRKPSFESPNMGESIEERLRDELGREVTICCSDDPCQSWVQRDVKFMIHPSLDDAWATYAASSGKRSILLQIARKCWYTASRFEAEDACMSASQVQDSQKMDSATAVGHGADGPPFPSLALTRRGPLVLAIMGIYHLLADINKTWEWQQHLPELEFSTIPALVADLRPHVTDVNEAFARRDPSLSYWKQEREFFYKCVSEIKCFERVVLPP